MYAWFGLLWSPDQKLFWHSTVVNRDHVINPIRQLEHYYYRINWSCEQISLVSYCESFHPRFHAWYRRASTYGHVWQCYHAPDHDHHSFHWHTHTHTALPAPLLTDLWIETPMCYEIKTFCFIPCCDFSVKFIDTLASFGGSKIVRWTNVWFLMRYFIRA